MMKKRNMNALVFLCAAIFWITGLGCTATTRTVSKDEELHYDAGYDFTDKEQIVQDLVHSLLNKPPLIGATDRPVIIVYDVANRTSEHISTSGITDDIRKELIASGRARFVNGLQREDIAAETDYQHSGVVTAESRVQKAKQIGAKYMISGTLRSIEKKEARQMRMKKKKVKYYSLNLELTDIETSLIEWADSVEIIREESKPFIGW